MTAAHLSRLDLNLLLYLQALLTEQNVTRAARRVGLTQSAMSRSLAKLRDELSDALLVRSGRGMLLTPRAEAMAPALARALGELEALVLDRPSFDPATARVRFTVCTLDFVEALLLPALMEHLARCAPGVDVSVVRPENDFERGLEDGSVDVLIGMRRQRVAAVVWRKLFHDEFACLLRCDHPAARGRFTLEKFLSLGHVVVATGVSDASAVDHALARLGKSRRVALRVGAFLVAPAVVASSDLVITHPARLARRAAAMLPLAIRKPPIELRGFDVHLGWHERRRHDAAHAWFRDAIVEVSNRATSAAR